MNARTAIAYLFTGTAILAGCAWNSPASPKLVPTPTPLVGASGQYTVAGAITAWQRVKSPNGQEFLYKFEKFKGKYDSSYKKCTVETPDWNDVSHQATSVVPSGTFYLQDYDCNGSVNVVTNSSHPLGVQRQAAGYQDFFAEQDRVYSGIAALVQQK